MGVTNLASESNWSLESDLDAVVTSVGAVWNELDHAHLFLTGGTGFIGCWLLESLRHADQKLGLKLRVTILTRDPEAFRRKAPHLASYPAFHLIAGDVGSFEFPDGEFSHMLHAATDASAQLNETDPLRMFDTIVAGTRRALDFAVKKGVSRALFVSSGAVYGQQPWEMEHVSEDWIGAPRCNDPKSAYAEGKRAAEILCSIYQKQFGLKIGIARLFALLGPYLALGIHFAAGNFIFDAIQGKTVVVKGDGRPCRSYLYASDLVVWLWYILILGEAGRPYNVGSDESISIGGLAERISQILGTGKFEILGAPDTGWNPGRYVPDVNLIKRELGLFRTVSLDEAIRRTALWNGWKGRERL